MAPHAIRFPYTFEADVKEGDPHLRLGVRQSEILRALKVHMEVEMKLSQQRLRARAGCAKKKSNSWMVKFSSDFNAIKGSGWRNFVADNKLRPEDTVHVTFRSTTICYVLITYRRPRKIDRISSSSTESTAATWSENAAAATTCSNDVHPGRTYRLRRPLRKYSKPNPVSNSNANTNTNTSSVPVLKANAKAKDKHNPSPNRMRSPKHRMPVLTDCSRLRKGSAAAASRRHAEARTTVHAAAGGLYNWPNVGHVGSRNTNVVQEHGLDQQNHSDELDDIPLSRLCKMKIGDSPHKKKSIMVDIEEETMYEANIEHSGLDKHGLQKPLDVVKPRSAKTIWWVQLKSHHFYPPITLEFFSDNITTKVMPQIPRYIDLHSKDMVWNVYWDGSKLTKGLEKFFNEKGLEKDDICIFESFDDNGTTFQVHCYKNDLPNPI